MKFTVSTVALPGNDVYEAGHIIASEEYDNKEAASRKVADINRQALDFQLDHRMGPSAGMYCGAITKVVHGPRKPWVITDGVSPERFSTAAEAGAAFVDYEPGERVDLYIDYQPEGR